MSRTVIYDGGIRRFFASSRAIASLIQKKADLIENNARVNIAANFESRTGELAASLKQIPFQRDGLFHIAVGADAEHRGFPYARALELGINPFTGEPLLGGNTRQPGGPQIPVKDKAYMVPAVKAAGFRQRS